MGLAVVTWSEELEATRFVSQQSIGAVILNQHNGKLTIWNLGSRIR